MPEQPIDKSAYDQFANACGERRDRCLAQLSHLIDAGPQRTEAHGVLRVTVHDVVGEARFLGFPRLSEVALSIAQLLDEAHERLGDESLRERLARWVGLLFDAAKLFATTVGDAGQDEMLTILEQEIGRERSGRRTAPQPQPGDESGRVLVLDDSEIVRYLLESHLESEGFTALTVETYEQLETRIDAFDPDMALIDINMPGIKGDEVCRRLRRRNTTRALTIVLMSSLSDKELARLASTSGADGFLSKQHGMEELATYLDELLATLPVKSATPSRGDETLRSLIPAKSAGSVAKSGALFSGSGSLLSEAIEAAATEAADEDTDDH